MKCVLPPVVCNFAEFDWLSSLVVCGVYCEVGCDSLVGDPLVVLADPNGVNLCPSLGRPYLSSIAGCAGLQRKGWNGLFL